MTGPDAANLLIGDEVTVDIGPVAHGGHCVARLDGRVIFVRYALPGERAIVRITDTSHAAFARGEAIRIERSDPRRVTPACAHFGPGGCGGCDFQHAELALQRELKGAVVAEQLSRLAGIDLPVTVEPLPAELSGDGFGWRTRVRWALDEQGRIGPRAWHSHQVVPVGPAAPCLIAAPGLSDLAAVIQPPPGVRRGRRRGLPEVTLAEVAGDPIAVWDRESGPVVGEQLAGARFAVAADGFWQAHRQAALVLSQAVGRALDGQHLTGGRAWDLYGGVGVFAAELAARVGPTGTVICVEADPVAAGLARDNLAELPGVTVRAGRVEKLVSADREADDAAEQLPPQVDVIVLDPPRSGAGRAVCQAMAARRPSLIVYVACDPAALARDTRTLTEAGYRLDTLRAFDCFPQTHHVECVARFLPACPIAGIA